MRRTSLILLAAGALMAAGSSTFFTDLDANHDGYVTRDEFRADVAKWLGGKDAADQQQLTVGLDQAFPASVLDALLRSPGPQNQTPKPSDVAAMEAALPSTAPAKPLKARKVLVLCKAAGYVHSSIPLAAKTVQELGDKTGAWTTTITYDPASITADNLKQYDLVFLDSTTGQFLDDPDANVTNARRKALLDFVRSGKGLAGIHAASDSYHKAKESAKAAGGLGPILAPTVLAAADGNHDGKVSAQELAAYSDKLFDGMDNNKSGKLTGSDVQSHVLFAMFRSAPGNGGPRMPQKGQPGEDPQEGTWPAFNHMIGGYFKWHWTDPTHIPYKIDDPNSPLTAMFRGAPFAIDDETYTLSWHSWSLKNAHELTSIDYDKMSPVDKAKEDFPRPDHDYPLSWIRREGKGRVFYMAHGHDEKVYGNPIMLKHLLAGIQYALGDLKADDSPTEK